MSRFDKYDPYSGGFRAPLNAALTSSNVGKMYAVSINSSGRVVIGGSATTDLQGIICPVRIAAAGDIIDVMTAGEITDALETAGTALTAGARVYGHADGTVDDTSTTGKLLGQTVELDRVIVRAPLS